MLTKPDENQDKYFVEKTDKKLYRGMTVYKYNIWLIIAAYREETTHENVLMSSIE